MLIRRTSPNLRRRLLTATALCLTSGITLALPVGSAETIYFDYGLWGRSLSTSSLEAFAADGTVDAELASYLAGLPPTDQQELQRILNTPLQTLGSDTFAQMSDPFVLSQWLYTPMGDTFLASLGLLIQTQSGQNGQQALRAAMILAAADPAGLSLINIIRFYPTNGLRLDLPQILALANSLNTNIAITDQLVTVATDQSQLAAASDPTMNYGALPLLAETGPFEVVQQALVLEDQQRDHIYPVDIYQPADLHAVPGPVPVMVFSHGYGETRTQPDISSLAHSVATNGFLVAVPEHIGSNQAYQHDLAQGLVPESFAAMEFINRPLDIRFLLDTLEQKNEAEFQGRLQLEQVGLMGYSFGGYTALATAGATVDLERLHQQCDLDAEFTPDTANIALLIQCRLFELAALPNAIPTLTNGSLADDRVGLVIAFAPLSNLFGEQGMGNIQSPVVIMGGAYDVAAPIALEQLTAFQWLTTPDKYFYVAENLSHTSELTRLILALEHPQSDIVTQFNAAESELFSLAISLAIAHGHVYLRHDDAYRPYLTAAYVETLSREPTKLHLLRSFPDNF
ncbi:MAG: alpha/beta hydrolase [Cyanobacteria bacterium P01_H01_bin.162]